MDGRRLHWHYAEKEHFFYLAYSFDAEMYRLRKKA